MNQTNKKITIEEIVKQLSAADLQQFIVGYAAKHQEFEKVFIKAFNPKKPAAGKEEYRRYKRRLYGQRAAIP